MRLWFRRRVLLSLCEVTKGRQGMIQLYRRVQYYSQTTTCFDVMAPYYIRTSLSLRERWLARLHWRQSSRIPPDLAWGKRMWRAAVLLRATECDRHRHMFMRQHVHASAAVYYGCTLLGLPVTSCATAGLPAVSTPRGSSAARAVLKAGSGYRAPTRCCSRANRVESPLGTSTFAQ